VEALAYDKTMADWRTHSGIDIEASLGAKVVATANGRVEAVYNDEMFGTTVVISHGGSLRSVYCNLAAEPTVKAGDAVRMGDVIGSVGRPHSPKSATWRICTSR
jgi:murein DD-endopeptidase MepM/ murein hydrolase activator NlpD